MDFPEGNKLFAGDFRANLDETNTENVTGNGFSNVKDTFAENFQLQMSVLHQSMCIFKAGPSSSYDWAKYKEKVPDVSDPNHNVETICNSKLKFT